MTTITIQFDDTTKLDKILNFIKRMKVPFKVLELPENNEHHKDSENNAQIQARLVEKYVKTGKWENMDDEERLDASLLEKMLYLEETGQTELLNYEENNAFKNEMKSWL